MRTSRLSGSSRLLLKTPMIWGKYCSKETLDSEESDRVSRMVKKMKMAIWRWIAFADCEDWKRKGRSSGQVPWGSSTSAMWEMTLETALRTRTLWESVGGPVCG